MTGGNFSLVCNKSQKEGDRVMRKMITLGLCAAAVLMLAGCCCPKQSCRSAEKCPKKECPAAARKAEKCPKKADKKCCKKAAAKNCQKAAAKGAKKVK